MTAEAAPRRVARVSGTRFLGYAGFVLALAALLLLAAGPVGWRAGWWSYQIAFTTLMPDAFYAGVAAIAVSALALIAAVVGRTRRGAVAAALGLMIGGVTVYFPWQASESSGVYPRMHDITTDFANPPSFEFAAAARTAEHGSSTAYPGPDVAALQQKFYPGIEPAMLDMPAAQAFARVLTVVNAKGWTIVEADPSRGVINAYDRSFWFGFVDDIAIRITATEDDDSRVDIRSGARQGRGDRGVNAARVRAFLAALKGK